MQNYNSGYNSWRLAALLLFAIAMGCAIAVYDTTAKLANCMKANRLLSESFLNSDAGVELAVHPRTGDVLVRVNGLHVKQFKQACSKVRL